MDLKNYTEDELKNLSLEVRKELRTRRLSKFLSNYYDDDILIRKEKTDDIILIQLINLNDFSFEDGNIEVKMISLHKSDLSAQIEETYLHYSEIVDDFELLSSNMVEAKEIFNKIYKLYEEKYLKDIRKISIKYFNNYMDILKCLFD